MPPLNDSKFTRRNKATWHTHELDVDFNSPQNFLQLGLYVKQQEKINLLLNR